MSWHVASLILRCRPEHTTALAGAVAGIDSACVHAAIDGRLIVTLGGDNEFQLADGCDALRALDGVLALNLVHHRIDDEDDEACDEHYAS